MKSGGKIAVFDFDGTITGRDTFIAFACAVRGRGALLWALLMSLPSIVAWKAGLITNSAAKQRLFGRLFKGMETERFARHGEEFADRVEMMLRPEQMDALRRHIADGVPVYIVTASLTPWVRPWAMRHGVSAVIGTEAACDPSGRLTGRFATPNCYGAEKVRRLRQAVPALEEMEMWAYGDSAGDDAMLALADHPCRV